MPTDKPRITITMTEDELKQIEDYRYGNKMKNQTQAILSLIKRGFSEIERQQAEETDKIKKVSEVVEFKDRLEQALKMRDMKPADLAKLTGIGEGAISQYRKGAYKATQRNLEKIAKVLDVSIPWLMGAEEKRPTPVSESGLDDEAKEIAEAYRIAEPYVQFGVRRLLGLDVQSEDVRFAARKANEPKTSTGPNTDVEI